MVVLRPHIMNWTTAGTPGGEDPNTGYPLPRTPGEAKSIPCHFHLGGIKEFKNEDNSVTRQIGRIRLDPGSELPLVGQTLDIPGHFTGIARDIYKGQLSWRIDV
jgi:hypothetical protein